ncbi:hypothetical protein HETIRDRAFT_101797 [Heterobasidion irregulare TC 32-1]|uniref:Uncharacterized protein n=1 Tax=Heterobasidion irregulare (strain TC 32-1) TaxID=747525 RepID=W4K5P0_HETIT|nr:uncharacterized protein HETIRDRAFT_101797 [Heterobasidion irregulare TC 32-1]ETW80675.1 hypothetical protein HETIRDRAFT_101797 [Heterobasidion irregulare TC 32-1]
MGSGYWWGCDLCPDPDPDPDPDNFLISRSECTRGTRAHPYPLRPHSQPRHRVELQVPEPEGSREEGTVKSAARRALERQENHQRKCGRNHESEPGVSGVGSRQRAPAALRSTRFVVPTQNASYYPQRVRAKTETDDPLKAAGKQSKQATRQTSKQAGYSTRTACGALRDISKVGPAPSFAPLPAPGCGQRASVDGGIEEAAWWIDSATHRAAARRAALAPRTNTARARATPVLAPVAPKQGNKASAGRRHRRHRRTPQHGQPIFLGGGCRVRQARRPPSASPGGARRRTLTILPVPVAALSSAIHRDHGAVR